MERMTIDKLKVLQGLSLTQKIDHTVGTIEAFMSRTGKPVFVSFSGGKDSTVLLDICRRYIEPHFKGVFINTGNEFPEIVNFVKSTSDITTITPGINIKKVIAEKGFPLISKEVSKYIREFRTTKSQKLRDLRLYGKTMENGTKSGFIPYKWRFLLREKFMVSEQCCDILKKRPIKKYQKESGELPLIATLATESKLRMQQYIIRGGCNSWKEGHLASYPLSIWTEKDVKDYIAKFNVDICPIYQNPKCNRTGCMFCGFGAHLEKSSRFELLYETHPKMYAVFMRYANNGVTYRQALRKIGVTLPDESIQMEIKFNEGN